MFDANLRKLSRIRTSAATFCSRCYCGLPFSGSVIVRLTAAVNVFLFLAGCAVVGDVLPPTLNLPMRATDMAVIEHGAPGSVVTVPQYSLSRSRYSLNDDFRFESVRALVAGEYHLGGIELIQRDETTPPAGDPDAP